MIDYLKLHKDAAADDDITRVLRQLYAAPRDEAYWHSLEARILSHVAGGSPRTIGWWEELDSWIRPMLVAAAVALLATGVALFRARQSAEQVTYEAMLTPTPFPVETAVRPVLQTQREATLRYLITR